VPSSKLALFFDPASLRELFGIISPLFPRGDQPLKTHDRFLPGRGASVREDWHAWLPDQKAKAFHAYSQQLEATYTMLSVSLDEAMELHRSGHVAKSFQAVCVTPALCTRLAEPLAALMRSLGEHAKHYGTVPNAAPLNPTNFQGLRGQRSARSSSLLSRVLLSHRSQFLHKLGTLGEMVEDLHRDFSVAASELSEGLVVADTAPLWQTLDACHFDLNTCLREAIVLLKSFLVAVPENELDGFEQTYRAQLRGSPPREQDRSRLLRHRRIAQIAGE
jgi:hypothetical protein